jgi:hypothetical protein
MSGKRGEQRTWISVESEANLEFIAGFPCTNYRCQGTLQRGVHGPRDVILCSSCGDVLYAFDREV